MSEARHKTVEHPLVSGSKAAGDPSADQLAQINRYTLREHTADELYVRSFFIAHNGIDRDGDVFDDALLEDFARTLPGKGIFNKHPRSFDGDSGPGLGTWFAARVLRMPLDEARSKLMQPNLKFAPGVTEALIVEGDAYMPRAEHRQSLITDIDAGAAKFVSIGFIHADSTPIRGDNDDVMAWRLHGPGEALETSFVWLGAQQGAAVHKSAKLNEDDDMADKETQQKLDETTKQLNDARPKAAFYDRLEALVGKEALEGEDAPERLVKQIQAGKQAHAQVVDDIVRLERAMGMVDGDSDTDVANAKAVYADMPMEKLQAYEKKLRSMKGQAGGGDNPDTGGIGGGDPNASGGQGGTPADNGQRKGLRDATATKSALGEQQVA